MSLQVWLPLNGNLNNQGLSNITVTNNGATVDNNGKIGKCYSFADNKYISTNYTLASSNTFSIFTWIKKDSKNGIGTLFRTTTKYSPIIDFNGTDGALRIFYWYDSSNYYMMTYPALEANIWYHVGITYDGATFCFYINGEVVQTMTASSAPYITGTFNIGKSHETNFFKGKMNDFRIYDHALSAKEIKELSKGLVLHYRLAGSGVPNQARDTSKVYTSPYSSFNGDKNICPYLAIVSTYGLKVGDIIHIHLEYKYNNIVPASGQTALCWIQGSGNVTDWNSGQFSGSPRMTLLGSGVYIFDYNITITADHLKNEYWRTNIRHDYIQSGSVQWKDFKVEKGSVATPWFPNPADALYSTLGYNNSIEYDCSGYCRNGTKSGSITWDANSVRYTTSYKFGANSYICAEDKCRPIDAITVAWWGYLSNWNNYNKAISCTENGGWSFKQNSLKMSFKLYQAEIGYIEVLDSTDLSSLSSGWHHWAATFDKGAVKLYRDGTLVNTYTSSSQNGIQYNTSAGLFIGADAGGSLTSPATAGTFNDGNLSDLRIYATALSADDVKELYETSASVSKGNIVSAYEFVE